MKTVLKATKRFAAVFLALAMVVLSLPETAMTAKAATGDIILTPTLTRNTTTIGGPVNVTVVPEITDHADLSGISYSIAESTAPDVPLDNILGVVPSVDPDTKVMTIYGTPTEVTDTNLSNNGMTFRITATNSNAGEGEATTGYVDVKFTVNGVDPTGVATSPTSQTFISKPAGGYQTTDSTDTTTYLAPQTFTVTNSSDVDLTGVEIALTGADAASYDLVSNIETIGAGGQTASFTVVPKMGLTAMGDAGKDGTYEAGVSLTANELFNAKELVAVNGLTFTVTNDIYVSGTGTGGTIVSDASHNVDLGSAKVGDTVSYTLNLGGTVTPIVWKDTSTTDTIVTNTGLSVTGYATGSTLRISGTIPQSVFATGDGAGKDVSGKITAKDSEGTEQNFTWKLKILPADVAVTVDGAAMASDNKDLEWYTTSGYTTSNAAKNIVIKNNSASSIKVNPVLTTSTLVDSKNFAMDAADSQDIEIPAGGSTTIKVYPQEGVTAAGSKMVGSLVIKGGSGEKGFVTKTVNLKFYVVGALAITTPELGDTNDGSVAAKARPIDAANLASSYEYAFEATGSATGAESWSLIAGTDATVASEAALKSSYGLTFSEDGTISGIPTLTGTVIMNVQVSRTNGGSTKTASTFVSLEINKADDVLTLKDGNTTVNLTNGITFDTTSTSDIETTTKTITVTNKTSQDFTIGKITAEDGTYYADEDDAGTTMPAATDPNYPFAVADGVGTNGLDVDVTTNTIKAGESGTFKLIFDGSKTRAKAGIYVASFKIAGTNMDPVIIPVAVTVTADPTIVTNKSDGNIPADSRWTENATLPVLADGTIAVDTAIAKPVQMKAYPAAGGTSAIPTAKAEWDWMKTSGTLDIEESGLVLSTDGKISGTPVKAGDYLVTLFVTDKTDAQNPVVGFKKVKITVATSATVTLSASYKGSTINDGVLTATTANAPKYFEGQVAGESIDATEFMTVNVSSDKAVSNVSIKLDDVEGKTTGSKNMFTLSKTSISSIEAGGSESFTIRPSSTVSPGVYTAKVTVSGNAFWEKVFYVQYTVAKALTITSGATYTAAVEDTSKDLVFTSSLDKYNDDENPTSLTTDSNGQKVVYKVYGVAEDGSVDNANAGVTKVHDALNAMGFTVQTVGNSGTVFYMPLATDAFKINATTVSTGGTVTFYIGAEVAKVVNTTGVPGIDDDINKVVAQTAEPKKVTLTVSKMGKVTVTDITEGDVGEASEDFSEYVFNELPSTYNSTEADAHVATFTLKNASTSVATSVTPKVVASLAENADVSTDFVVTGGAQTIAASNGTANWTIKPATGLSTGTHEAYVIFKGTANTDVSVKLSVTIAPENYSIAVTNKSDDSAVVRNGGTVALVNAKAGTVITDENKIQLQIENDGNMAGEILDVYEIDENGNKITVAGDKTLSFESAAAKTTETKYSPAALARYATSDLYVRPLATAMVTAGEKTGAFVIRYKTGAGALDYTDFTVNVTYTVYESSISDVTLTPDAGTQRFTTSTEEYTVGSSLTKTFTIKNGTGSGDATEALYGLTPTLEGGNNTSFEVSTLTSTTLAKGQSMSFTVKPKEALPAGNYNTLLRVKADNMDPIDVQLYFTVEAGTNLTLQASTYGEVADKEYLDRLDKTLDDLDGETGSGVATKSTSGDVTTYSIDLNASGKEDVSVEIDKTSSSEKITIKKLGTCDLTKYENILKYTDAVAGTSFKTITFQMLELVDINLTNAGIDKNKSTVVKGGNTKISTLNVATPNYHIWYKVPYGRKLSEAVATTGGDVYTGATLDTAAFEDFPGIVYTDPTVSFEKWLNASANEVTADTLVVTDLTVAPKSHEHVYPGSAEGDTDYVTWDWTKFDTTGEVTVSVACTQPLSTGDDPISFSNKTGTTKITVETVQQALSCTKDEATVYTASVTNPANGAVYTDSVEKVTKIHKGHSYGYVPDSISWGSFTDKSKITARFACTNEEHNDATDGAEGTITLTATNLTASKSGSATCLKSGTATYTAVFTDADLGINMSIQSDPQTDVIGSHKFGVATFDWNVDKETPANTTVTVTISCERSSDPSHNTVVDLTVDNGITKKNYDNGSIVYTAEYSADANHYYSDSHTVKKDGTEVNGDDKTLNIQDFHDTMPYTGKAVTQTDLVVLWGSDELTLNKDYTVKYANNKEVGDVATMTITGKGNYTDTITKEFTITARKIDNTNEDGNNGFAVTSGSWNPTTGKITNPVVTWGTKKLKIDTEYYVGPITDPDGDGTIAVTLYGTGNFTGEVTSYLYKIDNKNFLPATKLNVTVTAKNAKLTESGTGAYPDSITVKYGRNVIGEIVDSESTPIEESGVIGDSGLRYVISNHYAPGNATVTIYADTPIEVDTGKTVVGETKKTYRVTGLPIQAAKTSISGENTTSILTNGVLYRGAANPYTEDDFADIEVTVSGVELEKYTRTNVDSADYYLTVTNGSKAGSGKLTIVGMNAYAGAKLAKTFKIVKPDFSNANQINVVFKESGEKTLTDAEPYVQGGAKPSVIVTRLLPSGYQEELTEGVDYTVSYANNTKMTTTKDATVTITGKGNYQKKTVLSFKVGAAAMTEDTVTATRTDVKYASTKPYVWNYVKGKKPVVIDAESGKKLTIKKDYDFYDEWFVEKDASEEDAVSEQNPGTINTTDLYKTSGYMVYARIYPVSGGNYGADTSAEYVDVPAFWIYGTQLKATMIDVNTGIYYTGDEITQDSIRNLDGKGIITNLTEGTDFEIVGYKNNIKQGTATIQVRGIGIYGGPIVNKTFRINQALITKD